MEVGLLFHNAMAWILFICTLYAVYVGRVVSVLPVSFQSTKVTYLYHHIWQVWQTYPVSNLSQFLYFLFGFTSDWHFTEFTYLCWEVCFHYCLCIEFHVTLKCMFPHFLCRSLFWDMWMNLNNVHLREWVNKYLACGCGLLPAYQVKQCVC